MRSGIVRQRVIKVSAAIAVGAALSIVAPMAAEAVGGTHACGGGTPWGYQNATGSTLIMLPPGSELYYGMSAYGSYTREAAYSSNGSGKQGGGHWSIGGSVGAYSNYCQSFG